MSAVLGGGGGLGGSPDKALKLSLVDTLRLAWADPDIRSRLRFVLLIMAIFAIGLHIPVPIPGFNPAKLDDALKNSALLQLLNTFGGGALRKVSIFALGLNPYIVASIIIQVLTMSFPTWKQDLQEGGEYARRKQNKRTRSLTLLLCLVQGFGLLGMLSQAINNDSVWIKLSVITFWTAGSMFMLWLGEQVSERGIGNGVSLLIFAGIVISIPNLSNLVYDAIKNGLAQWWQAGLLIVVFFFTTWFIVRFTIAQRRVPIQHMRRMVGSRMYGGSQSYLPFSLNLTGVIPIIFAVSLIYMPSQLGMMFPPDSPTWRFFDQVQRFLAPDFTRWQGYIACLIYALLIFFFNYFYTAVQYNVEDIANNLKRGGSYIPGVRPGKQTTDFLNGVISRITLVGAVFLAAVALSTYVFPVILPAVNNLGLIGGTSMLIMVSVALETMRQIEANLMMKQYGA